MKAPPYHHKRLIVATLSIMMLLMLYFFKNTTTLLRTITFITVLVFFYIIDHIFDVKFKSKHYVLVIVMAVIGIVMSPLYFIYPQYDKIQHLIFPILLSSIVIYMVSRLKIALKWKIFYTMTATFAILGLFEMGEYLLDRLFDLKLQGVYLRDIRGIDRFNILIEPLDDTMADLSFGIVGCLIYAAYAYFRYHKYHKTI